MKLFYKRGGGVNRISYLLFRNMYVLRNKVKFLNKDFLKSESFLKLISQNSAFFLRNISLSVCRCFVTFIFIDGLPESCLHYILNYSFIKQETSVHLFFSATSCTYDGCEAFQCTTNNNLSMIVVSKCQNLYWCI